MSAAVEDHAWGRVVTDAPLDQPVQVTLQYEPDDDPRSVRFAFPSGLGWTFPREVLETGLSSPARSGDVEVWPCGRVQSIVEFHTKDGVAVVQFDTSALTRFLHHTYAATTGAAGTTGTPATTGATTAAQVTRG
ncbi:SsgA family sporulation/cell division regulator [Streptomyces sp. NPDC020965]|uniref:SsgA family sporulation/cell division regulator n=1 Tax=Streptomyces sp. NPDC020965 TaxID=3365105 RepID=UPI00379863DC